mgnify:FL=1
MGGKTSTASRTKYNAKTYERLALNLRIDSPQSKKAIEQAAEEAGESATAYVVEAVRRRMEREGYPGGEVKNIEVHAPNKYPDCYYISQDEENALKQLLRPHIETIPFEDRAELEKRLIALIHETLEEERENYDENSFRSFF